MTVEHDTTNLAASLGFLDAASRSAYQALRGLGLSADAARDALTVHVSDVLTACQRQRGDLPAPDDSDGGGVP